MFGIGTSEILIILLIALLVLGPKEIPRVARTLARGMRELQRAKDELRQTLDKEIDEEEAPKQKEEGKSPRIRMWKQRRMVPLVRPPVHKHLGYRINQVI
ncbi:MAG TPA: Sec-independent protein translocase protein TatB [Thermodesulfobacteriota bacterium]|nr:Sec-independent protein translocase protein TatB [Thermodesulfobacteriota bacterium]